MKIKRANGHTIDNAQDSADLRDLTPTEGQLRMRFTERTLRRETGEGEDARRMRLTSPDYTTIKRPTCSEDGTLPEVLCTDTRGRE